MGQIADMNPFRMAIMSIISWTADYIIRTATTATTTDPCNSHDVCIGVISGKPSTEDETSAYRLIGHSPRH
jgi:hypothetical protein